MSDKIELPIVTETETNAHISLMLIADGLRQAETNLAEQEANMRKLTDQITAAQNQVNQLQSMRIASMAQRNLLSELQKKIVELQSA
jgi:hypothetical protein